MSRLTFWGGGEKTTDYYYIDKIISEYFGIGGTPLYVRLYEGPYEQTNPGYTPGDDPDTDNSLNPLGIQSVEDVLFLENRDRQYSTSIFELRGIYNVADIDFDIRQFGLFMQNDTIFIEIHLNDMIALCGRRLIPGDVIELPHQRDDTIPNNLPAINKYYTVQEATRASGGYSVTWYPHIWRIKCIPMPASQEFEDILSSNATNALGFNTGNTLADILTDAANVNGINQAVLADAIANVPKGLFETRQYYLVNQGVYADNPWLFNGGNDGVPPNGATLLGSGNVWPVSPEIGQYFLRTDMCPAGLYMWVGSRWCLQEVNWRGTEWSAATRLLKSFINDDAVATYPDGRTLPVKQNLSKVILPAAGFGVWSFTVTETGDAQDYTNCTIDIIEIMDAQDLTDEFNITALQQIGESGDALDNVYQSSITYTAIIEIGNAIDGVESQLVAQIVEFGNAIDTVYANANMTINVQEMGDAEDQTFVFPGFPIILPNFGYAAGSNNYSIDGLDNVDIASIITNQMLDPDNYPTNEVAINNYLPVIISDGVIIYITNELSNNALLGFFTTETGVNIVLENMPNALADNVYPEPPNDEIGGGSIIINI